MVRLTAAGLLLSLAALAAPNTTSVTFDKDVLPILQKNCQGCHRPGEVAPMSLLTYQDARPWAKSIKSAVVSQKMPPWFADPKYGHFSNDRRLSAADVNTLVSWVDAGAPEGDPKDRLPALKFEDGWNILPDVVVEMPKDFQVKATGTINYQFIRVKGNFTEDVGRKGPRKCVRVIQPVHHDEGLGGSSSGPALMLSTLCREKPTNRGWDETPFLKATTLSGNSTQGWARRASDLDGGSANASLLAIGDVCSEHYTAVGKANYGPLQSRLGAGQRLRPHAASSFPGSDCDEPGDPAG